MPLAPPDCLVSKGSEASGARRERRGNWVLQGNLATQVPWAHRDCLASRESEAMLGLQERKENRAHRDLKASLVPQAQRVPEESEDPKGTPVRRATRDFKASQASPARRVPLDSQAKQERLAHPAPRLRRAAKGCEAHQACLVPLGRQGLPGFRALPAWMVWMGRTASPASGENPVPLARLDSWDPRVSRGKQDTLASQDQRATVESQGPPAAVAGPELRVSLVPWDPREDPAPLATLDHRGLQASQAQLGSLQWARKETREPLEKEALQAFPASLAHLDTLAPRASLVQMVQLAKRDPLENRDSMDPLAQRVTPDLQDRRARQERREELACLVGPARVAPWGLLGHRVLQEREATLDLQGLWGTPDCPGYLAPWETW